MYWRYYTRERAAQDIVSISHRLSHGAWVFRPIELEVKQQAIEDLKKVHKELLRLGYTSESPSLVTISSALSTLRSIPERALITYSAALRVAQILLPVVETLSISSSPFPVPNRHLPAELLHRIYDFVAHGHFEPRQIGSNDYFTDPTPHELHRQETILNLSATSTTWRRLVLDRPVIYLDSLEKIVEYNKTIKEPQQPWEQIHFDFSHIRVTRRWNWRNLGDILDHYAGQGTRVEKGKIVFTLNIDNITPFLSERGWGKEVTKWSSCWNCSCLRVNFLRIEDYITLTRVLHRGVMKEGMEKEYFLGNMRSGAGRMTLRVAQEILEGQNDWEGEVQEEEGVTCPVLTNYTTFAAPSLLFTAPIFLLETVPAASRPTELPPSRLRHLELSFQIDPTNPPRAIQELESFFSKIAPRIERLAFRLRTTAPHPSPTAVLNFTEHLVSSLLSCR
ncbi:hypothetical protein JCM3765_005449 [Sporobolomyces pararoseus]